MSLVKPQLKFNYPSSRTDRDWSNSTDDNSWDRLALLQQSFFTSSYSITNLKSGKRGGSQFDALNLAAVSVCWWDHWLLW